MPWRQALLTHLGAGLFSGIPFGLWLKVLDDNHYAVDIAYWGRAAAITLGSIPNSVQAWTERRLYGQQIKATGIQPPLFILGFWRSGTTHLHNLFAQDVRFAFATHYQVLYPHTFLTTEHRRAKVLQALMPKTRPQDNMMMGVEEPQEDEWALCSLTGTSPLMGWIFTRRAGEYDRYLNFRRARPSEIARWKSALTSFLQKLSFRYRRPLVLKSPGHTCRIKLLLELFPGAKFVHIHRNPYVVFQSMQHTVRVLSPLLALQRPRYADLEDRTLCQYQEIYNSFFEERGLIDRGHFHELSFEELEKDPIGQLRSTYEALDLPAFALVEPSLQRYVASLTGYKKNVFPALRTKLRARIARDLRRCFDEWGYAA